jgi:DNA transposition AAA+ family ATPase
LPVFVRPDVVNLLIVDEVDGLSHGCLEVLRHVFDKDRVSLVLLGRSGCAERLLNEDALASRVGMLHTFGTLGQPDTRKLLEQQLQGMKLIIENDAVEVFIEKTRGNFQAMRLVLDHIHYLVDRRGAFPVTGDVIEEAVDRLFTKRNVQRLREKR